MTGLCIYICAIRCIYYYVLNIRAWIGMQFGGQRGCSGIIWHSLRMRRNTNNQSVLVQRLVLCRISMPSLNATCTYMPLALIKHMALYVYMRTCCICCIILVISEQQMWRKYLSAEDILCVLITVRTETSVDILYPTHTARNSPCDNDRFSKL